MIDWLGHYVGISQFQTFIFRRNTEHVCVHRSYDFFKSHKYYVLVYVGITHCVVYLILLPVRMMTDDLERFQSKPKYDQIVVQYQTVLH